MSDARPSIRIVVCKKGHCDDGLVITMPESWNDLIHYIESMYNIDARVEDCTFRIVTARNAKLQAKFYPSVIRDNDVISFEVDHRGDSHSSITFGQHISDRSISFAQLQGHHTGESFPLFTREGATTSGGIDTAGFNTYSFA